MIFFPKIMTGAEDSPAFRARSSAGRGCASDAELMREGAA